MAYCIVCGVPNRPAARFCRSCGAQMELLEEEMGTRPLFEPVSAEPLGAISASSETGEELFPASYAPVGADPVPTDPVPTGPVPTDPLPPEAVVVPPIPDDQEDIFSSILLGRETGEADLFAPGALAGEQYRIRGVLENPDGSLTCEAEDILTCWSCASLQPQPNLRYCENCGAELLHWLRVTLVEVTGAGRPPVSSDRLTQHGGKIFRVEDAQSDTLPAPPGVPRFSVGKHTESGMVRDMNEDSLVAYQLTAVSENQPAPQVQFFAVADGIGGSDAGEVASRMAVRALIEELHCQVVRPLLSGEVLLAESLGEHLRGLVRSANRQILEKRLEKALDMGCTLTAALFYGADGVIANVGDSRTYLFRAGKLAQISADHSVVANLVAGGIIKPEDAYSHEQRNVILRSLGEKPELEVDLFPVRALPGDRFLLCSDGLWEMVRDNIIEEVLLEQPDPQVACVRLGQYANLSGGEDNISMILVDVHAQ